MAELTLLVLTVAAVAALRRRGTSDGDVDELVSAAPVLVSVIAALVLVRLYPLSYDGVVRSASCHWPVPAVLPPPPRFHCWRCSWP